MELAIAWFIGIGIVSTIYSLLDEAEIVGYISGPTCLILGFLLLGTTPSNIRALCLENNTTVVLKHVDGYKVDDTCWVNMNTLSIDNIDSNTMKCVIIK